MPHEKYEENMLENMWGKHKEPKPSESELSDLLCVNITANRVNYIKRLICGIKKEAKKHMLENHKDIIEEYPESICAHVADSLLLCSVLEQELFGITDT